MMCQKCYCSVHSTIIFRNLPCRIIHFRLAGYSEWKNKINSQPDIQYFSILTDLDDDDDFICAGVKVVYSRRRKRRSLCDGKGSVFKPRLQWNIHIELLLLEGKCDRTFRMRPASLEKILEKIAPSLSKPFSVYGMFGVEFLNSKLVQ